MALLLGLIYPQLIFPVAGLIVVLMLGAVTMHMKVKDPIKKALPASGMLVMSAILCVSFL